MAWPLAKLDLLKTITLSIADGRTDREPTRPSERDREYEGGFARRDCGGFLVESNFVASRWADRVVAIVDIDADAPSAVEVDPDAAFVVEIDRVQFAAPSGTPSSQASLRRTDEDSLKGTERSPAPSSG